MTIEVACVAYHIYVCSINIVLVKYYLRVTIDCGNNIPMEIPHSNENILEVVSHC